MPITHRRAVSSILSKVAIRIDSPVAPAFVMLTASLAFVFLRLAIAAHGQISYFVDAGSEFSHGPGLPRGLLVRPGPGYDGQMYYRFALDPFNLSTTTHGITIDSAFRRLRIGYSFLAWILALGHSTWVPTSLVVVNIVGLTALGLVSGLWSRSLGRHPMWGLLPAGYFGFVYSLARDLTEITGMAFAVGAIVAVRRNRPVLAGLLLAYAVLSRETAVVVVLALLLVRCYGFVRKSERPGRTDWAWVLPCIAFALWEAICKIAYGSLPLFSDRGNISVPFDSVVRAVVYWLNHPDSKSLLQLAQLGIVAIVVLAALSRLTRTRSMPFEQLAFLIALLLVISLSGLVWNNDPEEFRTMSDVFVLGAGVLLGSDKRFTSPIVVLASFNAVLWSVAAGLRIKSA